MPVANNLQREARRERVSQLRVRGLTIRQISDILEEEGFLRPDGTPWSHVTIWNDLKIIKEEWMESTREEFGGMVAERLAEIREARRMAWQNEDFEMVDKLWKREVDLLGLQAPDRLHIGGDKDSLPIKLDIQESAEKFGRLLDTLIHNKSLKGDGWIPDEGEAEDTDE